MHVMQVMLHLPVSIDLRYTCTVYHTYVHTQCTKYTVHQIKGVLHSSDCVDGHLMLKVIIANLTMVFSFVHSVKLRRVRSTQEMLLLFCSCYVCEFHAPMHTYFTTITTSNHPHCYLWIATAISEFLGKPLKMSTLFKC